MSVDRLFDAVTLGRGPALRNRLVMAPMTNQQSLPDGRISDDEFRWLTMRAEGGFGMVMTSATHIHRNGQCFPGELGISSDAHLEGLTRLAAALRKAGARSAVQLYHSGPRAKIDPIAPSEDAELGARALTIDEIGKARDDFIAAARRAEKAGFDGVEVHGAHGFLLCQFLSPTANRRTDRYGGPLENRMRLISEIISGIRASCRTDFQLGLRLSAERYGLRLGEIREAAQIFLRKGEIDYLDMSLWDVAKQPEEEQFRGRPLLSWFTDLERGQVKLSVAGAIRDAKTAAWCIAEGADFVLMGRAAMFAHDWPKRIAQDPEFRLPELPVAASHLAREGVSPAFLAYIQGWAGFVDANR